MEFPPLPPPENIPELCDVALEAIFEKFKKRVDKIVNMDGKSEEFLTMPPEKVLKLLRGELKEEKIKSDLEHESVLEHFKAKEVHQKAVYQERLKALDAKRQAVILKGAELEELQKELLSEQTLLQQQYNELAAKLKTEELKLIAERQRNKNLLRV
jgi:negative regulator of sigma E activity